MRDDASALMKKAVFVLIIIAMLSYNAGAVKLVQLTTSEIDEYDPAWSTDGMKIAYVEAREPGSVAGSRAMYKIKVITEDGKNMTNFVQGEGCIGFSYSLYTPLNHPAWETNRDIAYDCDGSFIYSWDPVGGGPSHQGGGHPWALPDGHLNKDPSFSADGTLAFTSDRSGNKDIWIKSGGWKGDFKQLTTNNSIDEYPAWNYNGSQIAFASDRSGTKEIWIMDRDGSNLHQLTNFKSTSEKPTWGPDGMKIAFTSYRSGNRDIWVINLDGTNARQLTTNESNDESPAWWPKSTERNKIAFTSDRSGNKDIWVVEFNESESLGTVGQNKISDVFEQYLPYLSVMILVGFFFVFKKRIVLGYYSLRMKKWKNEGYDISKLEEVLKK